MSGCFIVKIILYVKLICLQEFSGTIDRLGVKYFYANTNTNTNTFYQPHSNTNPNTNTFAWRLFKYKYKYFHSNTNTQILFTDCIEGQWGRPWGSTLEQRSACFENIWIIGLKKYLNSILKIMHNIQVSGDALVICMLLTWDIYHRWSLIDTMYGHQCFSC